MNSELFKAPFLAFLLGVGAFMWGYSRESIETAWASLRSRIEAKHPAAESSSNQANLNSQTPPQAGQAPTPAPGQDLKVPTFSETLEAIQPGKIEDRSKEKRNLYFEQLSQQLRTLQGEQPPNAGAAPNRASTAPVAVPVPTPPTTPLPATPPSPVTGPYPFGPQYPPQDTVHDSAQAPAEDVEAPEDDNEPLEEPDNSDREDLERTLQDLDDQ